MSSENPRLSRRPATLGRRSRLPEAEIQQIRRDRLVPRITQWDYLHLMALKRALIAAIRQVPDAAPPALDLFCGTKPYLELLPWRPTWGLDLDEHFGRADVVGSVPLPIRDGAVGVVWCTQALYLVDDPIFTVEEAARVLRPGGSAIVSILSHFRPESRAERQWSRHDLEELFDGWEDVRVLQAGGPPATVALVAGRFVAAGARRWPLVRPVATLGVVVMNTILGALELVLPLRRHWPNVLVLIAERPAHRISAAAASAS